MADQALRMHTLFSKRSAHWFTPVILVTPGHWPWPFVKWSWQQYANVQRCTCYFLAVRPLSVYCLVDELRQGCFVLRRRKKNKNKKLDFDSGRRKKIKKKLESWFFYWKTTNSVWIYAVFGKKNPLFFVYVGGKNKKMQLDVGNEPYLSQQICWHDFFLRV